jgi:hypothetical protein
MRGSEAAELCSVPGTFPIRAGVLKTGNLLMYLYHINTGINIITF